MKSVLLLSLFLCANTTLAQTTNIPASTPVEKNIRPFVGFGLFPQPVYIGISAGLEIGNNKEDSRLYSTIYMKAGNFAIENTFHSYFLELSLKLKTLDFKNNSSLSVELPIWLGNRNFIETFTEERHQQHDYSYVQLGSGIDLKYSLSERLTLISKLGAGYGPRYNYAGDFNFFNYRFEKYSWLPVVDLCIRYKLYRLHSE